VETAQPAYQENHRIVRENTFQAAYTDALQRARHKLLGRDIAACCAGGGALLKKSPGSSDTIELCFLNKTVSIALPQAFFNPGNDNQDVLIWEQILILHYLANSEQARLQHTLINYRRLRDGAVYAPAFERRCIQPLLATFGALSDRLATAAAPLGAVPADYGDCAVRIPVFPQLEIICCLWKGDAEFGPEAAILFDAGAEDFLCAEDMAVLCQQIVIKLIKNRTS